MSFIKRALEHSVTDNYIDIAKLEKYIDIFTTDHRHKLKWLACNCYRQGCSSGIIRYAGREYYFYLSGTALHIEYR